MPSATPTRPNILFITTDQQRWDHLSFHDTPGLNTPHLDHLARDGQIFPHAYVPSPICTPCRVSLLSGLYPSRHGAVSIGSACDFDFPTIPQLLKNAGYATGLFGKSHFVPRPCEPGHASGKWKTGEPVPDHEAFARDVDFWQEYDESYLGFDQHHGCRAHNADRTPDMHYRAWLANKGADLAALDRLHGPDREQKIGRWDLPAELHQNQWIVEDSTAFISAAEAQEQPWFCWASFQDPHSPFLCPDPWFSEVEPESSAPELESHADKPAYYDLLVQRGIFEDGEVRFYEPDKLGVPHTISGKRFSEKEAITARRAYKGMCNMIDAYVGKLLAHLEARGCLHNTCIVFTSDHGDFLGDHGLWYKGLPAFDESQRVPLIVKTPESVQKGRNDALVSLMDLPATFLSWVGAEIPPDLQGVDHSRVFNGETDALREELIVECNPTRRVNQFTLVTHDWKLVVYNNDELGELYDRRNDPHQRANLWKDPQHTKIRADLLHRLTRHLLQRDACQNPRISNA